MTHVYHPPGTVRLITPAEADALDTTLAARARLDIEEDTTMANFGLHVGYPLPDRVAERHLAEARRRAADNAARAARRAADARHARGLARMRATIGRAIDRLAGA